MTHNHSLGSDAVYLLQAFKGHGVHLAFQELGVERVYMGFEARYIYLSAVLSLHFVSVMKSRSEPQPISPTITRGGGKRRGGLQFLRSKESPFEHVVPDLAAFHAVDVLLRLRASVGVGCRRKEVDGPLLPDDPAGLGAGFELFWTRRGSVRRSVRRHWALGLGVRQRRKLAGRGKRQRVG